MSDHLIFKTLKQVSNPSFDRRCRAGIRSQATFPEGTVYVERYHYRTGVLVSVGILWGTSVHNLMVSEPGARAVEVLSALNLNGELTTPTCYDEIMLAKDSYWAGTGSTPSVAEIAIDHLLTARVITIEQAMQYVADALELQQ